MGKTKDEIFILKLYELTVQADDPDLVINRHEAGRSIGLHKHAVETICTLLAQANFIKKVGDDRVLLTPNGRELALRLTPHK